MTRKAMGNILLFPNLAERLFDMAMDARDQREFKQAKEHLEQVLLLEPENGSAAEALIATYQDLGMYGQAERLAEQVLLEGYAGNEEVFRLYMITLLHSEKYGKAYDLLSELVLRGELPDELQNEYAEILQTCKQLMEAEIPADTEASFLKQAVEEKLEEEEGYLDRLLIDLKQGDFGKQLQSIEQLKYVSGIAATEALKTYISAEENDPVLKTFALQALHHMGATGKVMISKFGQQSEVELEDVPKSEHDLGEQAESVMSLLSEQTYHHDPLYSSFASQIWIDFLFACYPLTPTVRNPEGWAAALHYATGKLLDQKQSQKDLASFYGTTESIISKHYKRLDEVLKLDSRKTDG